ncbi:MAG: class I SAM-dependent methyltransferase [Ignavibacteria bacterium]
MLFRKVLPGSASRLGIVDHNESYGRHVLENCIKSLNIIKCVDLGCGNGDDLSIVSKYHPKAELIGVDYGLWNEDVLKKKGIQSVSVNIETDRLPFEDGSVDFVIANQILEHTKEIFWINHEIFRILKTDGLLFMGTPNLLSLHNRILMMFGYHPTQHKLTSAHVRPFSKKDTKLFYNQLAGSLISFEGFWGSQFYPFPKSIARFLSKVFPSSAFSIFFLIRKTGEYNNEFINWLDVAKLETNFYKGKNIDNI